MKEWDYRTFHEDNKWYYIVLEHIKAKQEGKKKTIVSSVFSLENKIMSL